MLRIGFVGCGWANGMHMRNLASLEGVKLAAFQDIDEDKARHAVAHYEGRAYADSEAMLAGEKLDVLYVAVPPGAHGIELTAAQRGLHLFVEKPVSASMQQARAIAAAIAQAGVISSVGYHFRYMQACQKTKELLAGRTIGMALGYWMGSMPGVEWWRQLALSGGQAVEQTTHIFDLARWLVGEVKEVFAYHATRALQEVPKFDVWDVGTVSLQFESGAVGTIQSSCIVEQEFRARLEVVCKGLSLEIEGNRLRITEPGRKEELFFDNDYYLDEDKAFIAAVKSGNPAGVMSPYSDALKTLAVTLAANRSAVEGRPVKVAELLTG